MPLLSWRLNYKTITLTATPSLDDIGIWRKGGEVRYARWLGFITRQEALTLPLAKPVKLRAWRYALKDDLLIDWTDVPEGMAIQGCWVPLSNGRDGAYAVLHDGAPRLVPCTASGLFKRLR